MAGAVMGAVSEAALLITPKYAENSKALKPRLPAAPERAELDTSAEIYYKTFDFQELVRDRHLRL